MMWCGFRPSDSQCPSTCGCPEGVAAQERRCRLQFKVKEALIQRQRLDPSPFLQWMFGKTEAVYVELQVHSPGSEAWRTDPGQAQTMHEAKTQALWALEEKFSWRASQDFDANAPKSIVVFEDISTFGEVEVRLLSCDAETEELLGEALLKVDQDVEDWVGLEGELVVPLVRSSRVCGYVMFDVKLNCDGGTNPPRRFPQDGKGLSMLAVVGRPALKLPVETRRLLMDEEVEEIVPDFTWKDHALSKDLDAASPRTPQTVVKDAQSMRTRTPPGTPHAAAPPARGQPMATNFTTKDLAPRPLPQMPEDPVEEAVPLPSPGVLQTSAELIPGLSEPRVNARFAPPPHPELTAELGPMITASTGPRPLTPPGPRPLSGSAPGPRPLGTPQGQCAETGPGSMGPIPGTAPPGPSPGPPGPRPGLSSTSGPGPCASPRQDWTFGFDYGWTFWHAWTFGPYGWTFWFDAWTFWSYGWTFWPQDWTFWFDAWTFRSYGWTFWPQDWTFWFDAWTFWSYGWTFWPQDWTFWFDAWTFWPNG
eukprot:s1956_g3.t2